MDPWAEVRLRARACHAEALAEAGGDRSARAITAAAARLRDLQVVPFAPGTRFGAGILGVYERVGRLISVDATLSPDKGLVVVAHEIGHHELHDDPVEEVTSVDTSGGGVARLVGYSHRERRELAADAFASEFLCPSDWLREELLDRGGRPSEIARGLGLAAHLVTKQAVRGVLLPPLRRAPPRPSQAHPLDATQTAAATWDGGPLLVEAGPGTGKTKALVGRVTHLLASGVPASRILVLTFSIKAAAELRAHVAEVAPEAAGALWAGTFHAWGLEVIHGWHHRVGRGSRPRVLDPDGALELLERNLCRLPLAIHRDLREPGVGLAPVLRAIGRAKDEMVTPEDYAAAARAAALDGEGEAVESAAEVAAIYGAYQQLLDEGDALDLGDLVALGARLLEENDDIALHYGARFSHVLVDEYQDTNTASVRLLRSLCGPGTNLWVVGDARQSIYRFRGAKPSNVELFTEGFGGETVALGHNYRATAPIVDAFSAFTAAMRGGPVAWLAERTGGDPVRVMTAPTLAGETAALRYRIEELRAGGVGYGDQAVLARTHAALDRIGSGLERLGVPVMFLGDLFAREEVRDLLALVSLDAEPGGLGLLRVATRLPYGVPRADATAVVRWMATHGLSVAEALARGNAIPGLSAAAGPGLARLGRHLAQVGGNATAWTVMVTWLFETHGFGDLAHAAEPSHMRPTAIYQLLRLAAEVGCGRRAFLGRVRRIAALGGGREHGVIAPEAEREDAVRLSTIHAAKGLEFSAVHLPLASSQHVPMSHRPASCPPPPDLARLAMAPEDHHAEEQCLWFVAMSRARDHLTISHAARYTPVREARPSPFLSRIGKVVSTRHPDVQSLDDQSAPLPQAPRSAYPAHQLDTYNRCPRRYLYEVVDGLGSGQASGHRRFMRAIHAATRVLEEAAQHRRAVPSYEDGVAALATAWAVHGPVGHPQEAYLRVAAESAMSRMAEVVATEVGAAYHHEDWAVDLENGIVVVRPHRVVAHPWDAVTVQVMRSGRGGRDRAAGMQALLLAGARARFDGQRITVETLDPETGDVTEADVFDEDDALAPYRGAIAAIEAGAFAPRPSQRTCPSCPFFFVCGA